MRVELFRERKFQVTAVSYREEIRLSFFFFLLLGVLLPTIRKENRACSEKAINKVGLHLYDVLNIWAFVSTSPIC